MLTNENTSILSPSETLTDKRVLRFALSTMILIVIVISGMFLNSSVNDVDFANKNLPPSPYAIFGFDWLGRNVFYRTITGLSISIICACVSSILSTILSIVFGYMQSSNNRAISAFASTLCDLICGIPQIVLLLLISIALNRGYLGVIVGISVTHWASLSKILCGEIKEIKQTSWYMFATKNYSYLKRMRLLLPCLLPQIIVGAGLMFPHAILHESTITFLGFGLSAETPAVGIILSEASAHLANGVWWVAILPGLALILVTLLTKFTAELLSDLISQGRH